MTQLISNVLMQRPTDATECPQETKEYWASYATDPERFGDGPYNSIEEAKADIIDQYKCDIANGTWDVGDWTNFYIGIKKDFKDFATEGLKWQAESIVEDIGCRLDDEIYSDDPTLPLTEKNVALMTELLAKFFDECEFENGFAVVDIQEFEFSEVMQNESN